RVPPSGRVSAQNFARDPVRVNERLSAPCYRPQTLASNLAKSLILESTLSFLGLGIQPPTPSWGGMLSDGRENLLSAWWIRTFPGVVLMVRGVSLNCLGDWVRDLSDPRLRRME